MATYKASRYRQSPDDQSLTADAPTSPVIGNADNRGFTENTDPNEMNKQTRARTVGMGDAITAATTGAQNRYGNLEEGYRQRGDQAEAGLAQTPGYNDEEAAKLGVDYGRNKTSTDDLNSRQLTGDEQAGITGNPQQIRAATDPGYMENISQDSADAQRGATSGLQKGLTQSFNPADLRQSQGYRDRQGQALTDEGNSIGGTLQGEKGELSSAIDPGKLGQSGDFVGRYRMSNQDVQDMATQAGTTTGQKSQAQEDSIRRAAAAEGNSSPLAIAAAEAQVQRQGDADAGDAMLNARIAGKQMQAGREQTIEAGRVAGQRDISGRQMNAAETLGQQGLTSSETLGGQKVAAANTQEQNRMQGEQDVANRQFDAANVGGQAGIATENRVGQQRQDTARYNQDTSLANEKYIDQAAAARSRDLALNRQGTTADIQNTGFNQGMTTDTSNAQGAKTIGDARRTGEQEYRGYLTGQQQQAQQGGTTARGQQIQNAGQQTSGLNQTSANQGTYNVGSSNANTALAGTVISGVEGGGLKLADGGVVDEPGVYTVGEGGPEAIVPMDQHKPGALSRVAHGVGDQMRDNVRDMRSNFQGSPIGRAISSYRNRGGAGGGDGASADPMSGSGPSFDSPDMMGDGGIVTKPTKVLLGEKGPEMVVPLSQRENAKVTPGMLDGKFSQLASSIKSRYRQPQGPAGQHPPLRNNLPLVPSRLQR